MTAVAKLPSLSADLLALIGSYGLARTDGVSDVERLHRWEQLVAGIKQYAADSLAAASPAELGGVVAWCQADDPLSRTAFSWPGTARNPAHTTPLYATPRAAEAVIDDAMVERALSAMPIDVWNCDGADYMRAALTAALSPPSPGAAK